jgi:hypothetical protein
VAIALVVSATVRAHDVSTTPITWNREISRIFYERCVSCHRPGGTSFSLMTYQDVQPRAVAIRDAVLSRRMPPWGAVKGFGDFRNDQALTAEQIELITDWVQDDTPKGNNPRMLPPAPKFGPAEAIVVPAGAIRVTGTASLKSPLVLDGLLPDGAADGARIVAIRPDGSVEPLLWLYGYSENYRHAFLLRKPLALPAGTIIRGMNPPAGVLLLPSGSSGTHLMRSLTATVVAALIVAACGRGNDTASFKELHKVKSGDLNIVLLSAGDSVKHGKDSYLIEFRDAQGGLVDVGTVNVSASMPMAGMAPMFGESAVTASSTRGRYNVTSDLAMTGTWRFTITWNGPRGQGSTSLPVTAS